jgi:uncharacterized protein (TIGR00725 family)
MKKIVAVIGDRHCSPNELKAKLAYEVGCTLVDNGFRVLTGGMGGDETDDGVMDFAMKGAKSSTRYSDGDTIAIIPGFSPEQASKYADIVIPTGLDVYRNCITANADAVIAIGGGAGTLCEMAFAWSLGRLIIGFNNVEGWSSLLAGKPIDHRKRYKNVPDDCVYSVNHLDEIIDILKCKINIYTKRHTRIC